ncbi:MAG TPA: hypothetical protein VMH32_07650 [Burkholderiales bacterium]|nr:hypothetical protein [Burkholderiales bacterium]
MAATDDSPALRSVEAARPQLELSGPKLAAALETLIERTEAHGGVERFVAALQVKGALFRDALAAGKVKELDLPTFKALCAVMSPVRRRVGDYLLGPAFESMRTKLMSLLDGAEETGTADRRMAAFCAAFPQDRKHRWVRDLAAEVLHNVDPERYPLMCRWVWDARSGTGALREIWHSEDDGYVGIDVADGYGTFVMLREELAQFLTANGVFRDVIHYVDLLTAQVYAGYICEQGGSYLRADFNAPEDPMEHTRRLLGLDGVNAAGRTRLKCVDGEVFVVDDLKLLG